MLNSPKKTLEDIPNELFTQLILPHLKGTETIKLGATNSRFYQLSNDNKLWQEIIQKELDGSSFLQLKNDDTKQLIAYYKGIKQQENALKKEESIARRKENLETCALYGIGLTLLAATAAVAYFTDLDFLPLVEHDCEEILDLPEDLFRIRL